MAYFVRIRRKCASPKTTRWSTHSRRIDPISLSAKPFCQGEPGAMGLSRMPMVRNRCVTAVRGVQLAQLAAFHRLPAIYGLREYAEAGGLISYGTNIADAFRQAG